jgi:hypothetical protein
LQPCARYRPLAFHRRGRDTDDVCGLLDAEAAEEAQLHEPALLRIQDFQPLQCVVDCREIDFFFLGRRSRGYVAYLTQALLAAVLGDMDTAMERAQQSCDEREPVMVLFARNFRNLQRLRNDPRFADVLRRLALPGL